MKPFEHVVEFHGHACPGLAIGYRMTAAALKRLRGERSSDEEIVAIVENDACGVDAVQCLAGCTFGKGNLIFRDYGKQAYTLFCRESGRAVRVSVSYSNMPEGLRDDRAARIRWLLAAPEEDVVDVREVTIDEPRRARIHASATCDFCGERVMETRLRRVAGRNACIPCAESPARG